MKPSRWRCFWRGNHQPVRHPMGVFVCADCGHAGATLEEMGYADGWVSLLRRQFDRDTNTVTRSSWEDEREH